MITPIGKFDVWWISIAILLNINNGVGGQPAGIPAALCLSIMLAWGIRNRTKRGS